MLWFQICQLLLGHLRRCAVDGGVPGSVYDVLLVWLALWDSFCRLHSIFVANKRNMVDYFLQSFVCQTCFFGNFCLLSLALSKRANELDVLNPAKRGYLLLLAQATFLRRIDLRMLLRQLSLERHTLWQFGVHKLNLNRIFFIRIKPCGWVLRVSPLLFERISIGVDRWGHYMCVNRIFWIHN